MGVHGIYITLCIIEAPLELARYNLTMTKTVAAVTSLFSYCVFLNSERSSAFSQVQLPAAALAERASVTVASASLSSLNANQKEGCSCPGGCPSCDRTNASNCPCPSCRSGKHGPACGCSNCRK